MLVQLLANHGGSPRSMRFQILQLLAVAFTRFRYWGWGGIFDAARIAKRGDTTSDEFFFGMVTCGLGLWWAIVPQPTYNVFGFTETVLPSILTGGYALLVGRNALHQIVSGSIMARMGAVRWMFGAWAFLLALQMAVNPTSIAMFIWAAACLKCYWIHSHLEKKLSAKRCFNKGFSSNLDGKESPKLPDEQHVAISERT